MIPVTRSFLPALGDYVRHLEDLWQSAWLTNFGPKHEELERALAEGATVDAVLVSSGTMALTLVAHGLDLEGDVLTTPFTFIATASAMAWSRCTPRLAQA